MRACQVLRAGPVLSKFVTLNLEKEALEHQKIAPKLIESKNFKEIFWQNRALYLKFFDERFDRDWTLPNQQHSSIETQTIAAETTDTMRLVS